MSSIICRTRVTADSGEFFHHRLIRNAFECQRLVRVRLQYLDTSPRLTSTDDLSHKPRPHLRVRCHRHHGSYASVVTVNRILSFEIVTDPQTTISSNRLSTAERAHNINFYNTLRLMIYYSISAPRHRLLSVDHYTPLLIQIYRTHSACRGIHLPSRREGPPRFRRQHLLERHGNPGRRL